MQIHTINWFPSNYDFVCNKSDWTDKINQFDGRQSHMLSLYSNAMWSVCPAMTSPSFRRRLSLWPTEFFIVIFIAVCNATLFPHRFQLNAESQLFYIFLCAEANDSQMGAGYSREKWRQKRNEKNSTQNRIKTIKWNENDVFVAVTHGRRPSPLFHCA